MLTTTPQRPVPSLQFRPVDRRGYYRSPVTLPDYRLGREPANKGRKFPPEPLTPNEVYRLIDACGGGSANLRNRALIMLLWRTGLRIAEALALLPKDVDLENGRVAVLHGKGNFARVVALDYGALPTLKQWERDRRALELPRYTPYFCVIERPTRGKPVGGAYIRDLFKDLGEKAEIEKRVHPHGLRHTYASYLLDNGVPIHYISKMLGHASIEITQIYADHVNPARVIEELRLLTWPEPSM